MKKTFTLMLSLLVLAATLCACELETVSDPRTTVAENEWEQMFLVDNFSAIIVEGNKSLLLKTDSGKHGEGEGYYYIEGGEVVPAVTKFYFKEDGVWQHVKKHGDKYFLDETGDVIPDSYSIMMVLGNPTLTYSDFTYDEDSKAYVCLPDASSKITVYTEDGNVVRVTFTTYGEEYNGIDEYYFFDHGTTVVTIPEFETWRDTNGTSSGIITEIIPIPTN